MTLRSYEIIKTMYDENDPETGDMQSLHLVKLGQQHIARMVGTQEYVEVEYVLVGAARLHKQDASGTFTYEETAVTASDAEGEMHKAFLYLAPRALSVPESMFALGEINTTEEVTYNG